MVHIRLKLDQFLRVTLLKPVFGVDFHKLTNFTSPCQMLKLSTELFSFVLHDTVRRTYDEAVVAAKEPSVPPVPFWSITHAVRNFPCHHRCDGSFTIMHSTNSGEFSGIPRNHNRPLTPWVVSGFRLEPLFSRGESWKKLFLTCMY